MNYAIRASRGYVYIGGRNFFAIDQLVRNILTSNSFSGVEDVSARFEDLLGRVQVRVSPTSSLRPSTREELISIHSNLSLLTCRSLESATNASRRFGGEIVELTDVQDFDILRSREFGIVPLS